METLKCPVCGEVNPGDVEFCQNCQSRLQPLTGPLRGENNPIQPGQIPTKKVTSELEPILPKWLREAREKARKSSEEPTGSGGEPPTTPISPKPDLLAGLATQSREEDEEEVPDWLAGITGGTPSKKKKLEHEDAQVKWVELGGPDDFAEPSASPLGGTIETPSESFEEKQTPPWMAQQKAAPENYEPIDWQSQRQEQSAAPSGELAGPFEFTGFQTELPPAAPVEDSDWLKNLQTKPLASTGMGIPPSPPATSGDVPDWLKNLESQQPESEQSISAAPHPLSSAVPDWLQSSSAAPSSEPAPAPSDVPDWLKSLDQVSTSAVPPPAPPAPTEAVPDWLKAAAPQPENQPPPIESKPAFTETPPPETPDWLSSLKPVEEQQPKAEIPAAPVFTAPEPPAQEPSAVPAFADESIPEANIDDIFASMQMPDWLSSVAPTGTVEPPAAAENPPSTPQTESSETPITPAELPSWVKAMRPVESGLPTSPLGPTGTSLETNGPLEGLHDVLPAVTGMQLPMSKPKAHSIKLSATEEQQAQAVLLEQILAAETAPIPMKSGSMVLSQRVLRWFLTAILFLFLGSSVFVGTKIFPLPQAISNDVVVNDATGAFAAMSTLDKKVPNGSPVLVIFDYEPSTMGEMEATASPLFVRLIVLKSPKLTLLSTSPTGSALAEQLMSSIFTIPPYNYQRGVNYVDLGYLAGGLAGVNDFAQNPATVIPLDVEGHPIWQSAPLQNVTHLSDFAAIIVLTDSAEAGRVWIEQTTGRRGETPLLAVSSAQAGPMLFPYVQSGQLSGLVAGLNSAVYVEQNTNGLPGFVRRYWDAYSIGLLLAVVLIVLGGLWNLVLGIQSRRAAQGQG